MTSVELTRVRVGLCLLALVVTARASASPAPARPLTLDDRIAAQRAIEEVYWRHRIWPKENPGTKPPLSQVMPDAALRAKVEDYLRKSNTLESLGQKPISVARLQAELDRIAKETRDGATLQELFHALGDDPALIAETLGRQTLIDRSTLDGHANENARRIEPDASVDAFVLPQVALTSCVTDSWTPTSAVGLVERQYHTAVWTGVEMIVWGGSISDSPTTPVFSDGARYNPVTNTWSMTSLLGRPNPRYSHTAVWTGTEMIVWGGKVVANIVLNDGGRYNPATDSWVATSTGANCPAARAGHTAVWTGTRMLVWGGSASLRTVFFNSGGGYDPSTDSWVATAAGANVPSARDGHTAVWTGTQMIVWGGADAAPVNTGGRYDPVADSWTATSTGTNVPTARVAHTAVWTGSEMIAWGGLNGVPLNSGGRYNPVSDSWARTSIGAQAPFLRELHGAVWSGAEMIVWGGTNAVGDLGDGSRYTPATDSWRFVPIAGLDRHGHTTVWTGTEMIVWGGSQFGTILNDGARYCACSVFSTFYADFDGDGFGNPAAPALVCAAQPPSGYVPNNTDCDDGNAHVYPGAPEINDGLDNQCPGGAGYGLRDEIAGTLGFLNAGDKTKLSWPAQPGASAYTAARSPYRDFHAGCRLIPTASPLWSDLENPPPGGAFFYVVRSADPFTGSWGARSSGVPRTVCGGCGSSADACDDGNPCTDGDQCSGTTCLSGSVRNCDDGLQCTADSCDVATGCVHTNLVGSCDDGNACTTADACSGASCVGGAAPNCDDGNACTADSCDPASGCVHTDITASCHDASACTIDSCNPAIGCVYAPVTCNDNNACTTDSCNPATGCVFTPIVCNDNSVCTTDSCNPATGCVFTPVACNDNNACTTESCSPVTGCVFTPISCDDGNACTADSCAPASGCAHAPITCNDGNVCTDDSCNPASGCVFANNTATCNDGNACTSGDVCSGGVCAGTLPPGAGHLVISQIQTAGDGGTPANDEFIEIYNPTAAAVALSGWSVQSVISTFPFNVSRQSLGTGSIPSHGWFLVATSSYNGSAAADQLNSAFTLPAAGNSVFLVNTGTGVTSCTDARIVDKVGYGTGTCPENVVAAAPAANDSILRKPGNSCGNGTDTNSNAADFVTQSPSTPRNSASSPQP